MDKGAVVSECFNPRDLPSLYLNVGGYWIEISPYDYMVDVSPGGDGSICQLMIFENPFPFNLIGIPGFNGYCTIHDPDNSRIGFVPTLD